MSILSSTSTGKGNTVAALMCAKLLEGGKEMKYNGFAKLSFTDFCRDLSLDFHVEEVEGHSIYESCASRLTVQELMVPLLGQFV